jgi:hypothetical protein
VANLPPRVATRARGVAVATTTKATAAHGRRGTAVAGGAPVAASIEASLRRTTPAASVAAKAAAATTHTTNIAGSSVATATTTTTAATAATTEAGALTSDGLEELRNFLVGLLEKVEKVTDNTTVTTVEESSGNTSVSCTSGTTDAMNVVVDVGGKIVVDDVSDVRDIKTTGSDGSGHENGAASRTEHLQRLLTLALGAVTVNGCGRETLVDQEVGERVGHTLSLDEDQRQTSTVGVENVEKDRALVNVLNVLDLLGDVLRCGTNTTDRKEDVVLQEIAGKHLDVAGEGGREHESLAVGDLRHILTLDNTANLRLETHVQHAIGLIKNKVLDVLEGDAATLDQINETTGGSNEKIAATLDLAKLGANVGTTVDDARTDPRTVGELAGLVEDLGDQLTGGGQNQRGGVGLALTAVSVATILGSGSSGGTILERLGEDGEQETTSLTRTSLGTSHQVTTTHDNWDRVLLDRSGDLVPGELDVAQQMLVEGRVCESGNGLGDTLARGLDRDVIVLLEVDTSLLLRGVVGYTVELALDTGVGGTGDVLAILPLSITGTTGCTTAASTLSRSEVGSAGPVAAASAVHGWGRTAIAATALLGSGPPGAVARGRTAAVHGRRSVVHRRGTAAATAKVRRNVGRALLVTEAVLLRSVLGVVQIETTHVELFSHDEGLDYDDRLSDSISWSSVANYEVKDFWLARR